MRGWAIPTSSSVARSKACGHTYPPMPDKRIALITVLLVAATGAVTTSQSPSAAQPPDSQAQLATVRQYCAGCHSDRVKAGGVSFEGLTAEAIAQRGDVFEKAVRKLRGRVMPPPGARQPESAAVDSLVAWLEQSLDQAATHAHVPDRLVLHRLNRKEY